MSDRAPTTEKIRRWCMDDGGLAEYHDPINGHLQAKTTGVLFDRWLAAHDAEIRTAALEEAAVIAERFVDHYPEDIFTPEGTSVDAQSARVIRSMAPVIASEIRAEVVKS